MRTKLTLVLAALTAAGLALPATQAMADSLHLSLQSSGVTINLNVGDDAALNPQPLPPRVKYKPGFFYDDGVGRFHSPKFVQAQYDDYDNLPPPKHWKKGKFSKYGQYSQFQQGGFGDEVMLNPQPLPPKQFHYVNWN
jgi:hypothetical protein